MKKLYKMGTRGKLLIWSIGVEGKTIRIKHGELNGKQQVTEETFRLGKNIGKENETTPEEQAKKEAVSRYEKKLKSGYVKTIEEAEKEIVDKIIQGGINPMLAHDYTKHKYKIKFPCYVQPKLDGVRCIAIIKDGKCTLWTRTRKPITSCPHIIKRLEDIFKEDIILDGELYNHELRHDFEKIVSAVRKENPTPEVLNVEYHIYDVFEPGITFIKRLRFIAEDFRSGIVKRVETLSVSSYKEVDKALKDYMNQGYEGVMVRNMTNFYEQKRSYNLLKYKVFEDAEFEIVGVTEGRGKLSGLVGAYKCVTKDGQEFEVKPMGDQESTRSILKDPSKVLGKMLLVKFQGFTGARGVPRFPVGIRIRESLDF